MKKQKKRYTRPQVIFKQKIEAFASTCIANPLAKINFGQPNSFGRTCQQLHS